MSSNDIPWIERITTPLIIDPDARVLYIERGEIRPCQTFQTESTKHWKHGALYCTAFEEQSDDEIKLALMFGRHQITNAIVGLAGLAVTMDDRYLKRTRYTLKRLAGEL